MEITGTNGVISMDMFAQDMHLYSDDTMSTTWVGWGSNIDVLMVQDFVSRVANGQPVSVTGEDGLRAVEVALGAYQSFELGEAVRLPLG